MGLSYSGALMERWPQSSLNQRLQAAGIPPILVAGFGEAHCQGPHGSEEPDSANRQVSPEGDMKLHTAWGLSDLQLCESLSREPAAL